MKNGLCALALAAAGLAAAPAVASADSIVFLKDYDVWLVAPDGSKLTQVTTDGDYEHPYLSPSQADDGTIAVSKGTEILRMRQNGEVINRLDPPPLTDSVSHPVDGVPVDVAISPDGTKIAYSFANYSCPVGASCGARTVTGYTAADHLTPPEALSGSLYTSNPSWVGNSRTLTSAGYGHQINVHDLGPGTTDVHWFDDTDIFPGASNTDLGDAEMTRQGDKLALIRGYGDDKRLLTLKVDGAGIPAPACLTSADPKLAGPTWAPDGTRLAWGDSDGLGIGVNVPLDESGCDAMQLRTLVPGGSAPHWGPADVNPQPRTTTPAPAPSPAPSPATPRAPALTVKAAKLKTALAKGLRVTLTGVKGTVKVTASAKKRVVGSGRAKAKPDGTAIVTVRFTKNGVKRLKKLHRVTLTVRVAGGPSRTVTLKH